MSIQALRERHSALAKSIENLLDKNVNPTWNGDLEAQYKAQLAEMDTIAADISRQNTFRARMTEHANAGGGQISDDVRNQFTRTPGAHSDDVAGMRAFLAGGVANMSEEARSRMQARQSHDIRNAMSTTTGSEGGYTVAPEYFGELTAAMRAYGGVRAVARTIQSASGAVLNFPTADATAEVGEIVGQSQSASAADTTFGNSTLEVFKYSSKVIAVPFELIQDSMFDIQGYVQALLALRIGRITAQHFAVGSGVGQPRGLITAAAVGKAAASGQVASITYEDLVDLEHSVDPAYRTAAGWMMHDSTLRVIRKIKDDEGRPIFVPGYEQATPVVRRIV